MPCLILLIYLDQKPVIKFAWPNEECIECDVTGNAFSLVYSSLQIPKTVER